MHPLNNPATPQPLTCTAGSFEQLQLCEQQASGPNAVALRVEGTIQCSIGYIAQDKNHGPSNA